ncbi:hypothetical protein SynMEDNS5_02477 [Synechococcus sp. MEDNS5]|nr:hypothetical protein SynMEDNS5_02477 [Synechococcus sp. MEDNS5]
MSELNSSFPRECLRASPFFCLPETLEHCSGWRIFVIALAS